LLFHGETSQYVKSHNLWANTGNPYLPAHQRLHTRRAVGTQNDKGLVGTTQSADPTQQNETKTELMMLRPLKSFADWSLKVVAVRTADNSDFGFEFPSSSPQTTPSALTTPLEQSMECRRDPIAEYPGWYHGGLND
jgi:hypothetical protein